MKWPCCFKTLYTIAPVTWDHIPKQQEPQTDCYIIQSISDIIISRLLNHTLISRINLLHIFTTIFILHAHYFQIFTKDSLLKIYGHEWFPFSCLMYHLPHYIYSSTITVKSKNVQHSLHQYVHIKWGIFLNNDGFWIPVFTTFTFLKLTDLQYITQHHTVLNDLDCGFFKPAWYLALLTWNF